MDTTMDRDTLGGKLLPELQQIAQTMGVEGAQKLRKAGLIDAIVAAGSNGGGEAKPARARRTTKPADDEATPASAEEAPAAEAAASESTADDAERSPRPRERGDRPIGERG